MTALGLERIVCGEASILEACSRGGEFGFRIDTPPSGFSMWSANYVGGVFEPPLDLSSSVLEKAVKKLAADYHLKVLEGPAQLLGRYSFRTQEPNEKLLGVWHFWGSSKLPIVLLFANCFAVQKDCAGLKKPDSSDSTTIYDAIKELGRLGQKTSDEMADVTLGSLRFSGTSKGTFDQRRRLVVPKKLASGIMGQLVVLVTKPHDSGQLELVVYNCAGTLMPKFPGSERTVSPNTFLKIPDEYGRINLGDVGLTVDWILPGKRAYFTGHDNYFIISGTRSAIFPLTAEVAEALQRPVAT